MDRRQMLGLTIAALAGGFGVHAVARGVAPPPARIVAMDFGLIEMLLTLGVTPLATSVPDWYRRTNVAPPLPEGVIDIGLLYQPNFELLEQLRPDLFLITPAHAPMRGQLERIAPTLTLALSAPGVEPWRQIGDETRRLARRLGRERQGDAAIASAEAALAEVRERLARHADLARQPLFVVEFVDDRHVLAYGPNSLFGDVMTRVGLRNAWRHEANARGYAVTDFTRLGGVPDARLVYIEPLPGAARATLAHGVLWQSLPFARAERVTGMPKVSQGGALYSGARFARQLLETLLPEEPRHA
ncbi:Iron complex transport system substrate-binding protein [Paraburkholderia unamae]|uniref:ABC transporter substrate-binding protein n=1 Tax=Paraburkholderia unamae TaxID=219649 RepID=UPI001CACA187|nr:ABC transporter substrate-binding protein [Paraburkholderia unamae]CAG9265233.1 Iron complex transport system substrate-binding protein [Paraburkholderia unamae]